MTDLASLVAAAKELAAMSPEQQREQVISFVYGNLATDNPAITREDVASALARVELGILGKKDDDDEKEDIEPMRFSPMGSPIERTLETIPGSCGITWQGEAEFDFDGTGTDVDWDNQKSVVRAGEQVFLDEDGCEFLASELITDPEKAIAPKDYVSPWRDRARVEKLVEEKLAEAVEVMFARTGTTIGISTLSPAIMAIVDQLMEIRAASEALRK